MPFKDFFPQNETDDAATKLTEAPETESLAPAMQQGPDAVQRDLQETSGTVYAAEVTESGEAIGETEQLGEYVLTVYTSTDVSAEQAPNAVGTDPPAKDVNQDQGPNLPNITNDQSDPRRKPDDPKVMHEGNTTAGQPDDEPAQPGNEGGGGAPPIDRSRPIGDGDDGKENGDEDSEPTADSASDNQDIIREPETVEEMVAFLVKQVDEGIQSAVEEPPDFESQHIGEVMLGRLNDADTPEATEEQFDTLLKVADLNSQLVNGCVIAIHAGHQEASGKLDEILTAEQRDIQQHYAQNLEENPTAEPRKGWSALTTLARTSAALDIPPDEIDRQIEAHAATPGHAWHACMFYYKEQAEGETPEAAEFQDRIDAKVRELIDDPEGRYTALFKVGHMHEAIEAAADPELRATLAIQNLEYAGQIPLTISSLKHVRDTAVAIAKDPVLSAQSDFVETYDRIIARNTDRLLGRGEDAYNITSLRMNWTAHRETAKGTPPEAAIKQIDHLTGQLLGMDIDEEHDYETTEIKGMFRNRGFVVTHRDEVLAEQANGHLKQNNFVAASTYISSMIGNDARESAMVDYLKKAATQEQIDLLKPSELELSADEDVRGYFEQAEAKVAGNIEVLKEKTRTHAFNTANTAKNRQLERELTKDAFDAIAKQDPAQAVETAREVLRELRAAGMRAPYLRLLPFSQTLVEEGDLEEAKRMIQDMDRDDTPRGRRTLELWKLGRRLQKAQQQDNQSD